MSGQTLTIVSGVVLLMVFTLVGWNLRRRSNDADKDEGSKEHGAR